MTSFYLAKLMFVDTDIAAQSEGSRHLKTNSIILWDRLVYAVSGYHGISSKAIAVAVPYVWFEIWNGSTFSCIQWIKVKCFSLS
jgi:hypothetical protein